MITIQAKTGFARVERPSSAIGDTEVTRWRPMKNLYFRVIPKIRFLVINPMKKLGIFAHSHELPYFAKVGGKPFITF
jgi:hypothetical protein